MKCETKNILAAVIHLPTVNASYLIPGNYKIIKENESSDCYLSLYYTFGDEQIDK